MSLNNQEVKRSLYAETEVVAAGDADVAAIANLLKFYSEKQIVLARDEDDIRHYLGNFLVAKLNGQVVGCVAVRDFGARLWEVRSLAVLEEYIGSGIGRKLVEGAVKRLRDKSGNDFRLFALTLEPEFFARLSFEKVGKELFPEKIWCDCKNCPKFDCCDEIAMLYRQ